MWDIQLIFLFFYYNFNLLNLQKKLIQQQEGFDWFSLLEFQNHLLLLLFWKCVKSCFVSFFLVLFFLSLSKSLTFWPHWLCSDRKGFIKKGLWSLRFSRHNISVPSIRTQNCSSLVFSPKVTASQRSFMYKEIFQRFVRGFKVKRQEVLEFFWFHLFNKTLTVIFSCSNVSKVVSLSNLL